MPTPGEVITGSTDRPILDGTVRGFLIALSLFAVGYAEARLDWLTDTEMAVLLGLIGQGWLSAFGMWDAWARGHVLRRAKSPTA